MKLQTLGILCITATLHLSDPNLCHSQTTATKMMFAAVNNYRDDLVGTWRFAGGDAGGQQTIDLELRSDGSYTKTLAAIVQGTRYGGTHRGTWTANGMVVRLSGDGNWPSVSHDLSRFTRLR